MPRLKTAAVEESARRDTIGLHTFVTYDPMAPRPTTPIMVGKYVVARRPLLGSIYTLFSLMDGNQVVASWISHPSEDDCASALRRLSAKRIADAAITNAKIRKSKPRKAKETA